MFCVKEKNAKNLHLHENFFGKSMKNVLIFFNKTTKKRQPSKNDGKIETFSLIH